MIGVKKTKGFTLVELLVASTLFVLSAMVLGDIYTSFYVLHRKVSNQATLAQEMRFSMEFLVRQTRMKLVNYPAGGLSAGMDSIDLIATDGSQVSIGLRSGAECKGDVPGMKCIAYSDDLGTTWYPITGNRTNVTYFTANVRPLNDPFQPLGGGGYDNNIQPSVTYSIGMTYVSPSSKDNISLAAQTAVSQRQYVR